MKLIFHILLLICCAKVSAQPSNSAHPDIEALFDSMTYRGFDTQKYFALDLLYWEEGTNKAVISYADTTSTRWLYGLINQVGDTLSPAVWPLIKDYSCGIGVILSAANDEIIEFSGYKHWNLYNDGLSGAVDTDGRIVIPFRSLC